MFERVIIASGTSNRQTKALAASVRDAVKSRGMSVMSTEGEDNGEWIIVDCGAAVAHIMQPAIRDYYHLEEIWGGKAVRMKVGQVQTALVKASEPPPARQAAAAKADKTATKTAAKTATRKAPEKATKKALKEVVAKKAANRTAAYQRVAGRAAPRAAAPAAKTARKAPRNA
jgi:ribosome-associated protein